MFGSLVKRVVVNALPSSRSAQQIRKFSVNLRSQSTSLVSTSKSTQQQSMVLFQKRNVSRWKEGMEVIGKEPMFWPQDDPNSEYRKNVKSRLPEFAQFHHNYFSGLVPETDDDHNSLWTWQVILCQVGVLLAAWLYIQVTWLAWGEPTSRYPFYYRQHLRHGFWAEMGKDLKALPLDEQDPELAAILASIEKTD